MVSVFEGQLTRTWLYPVEKASGGKRTHVINLYHDTITGVRSVMLDFQEIPGSVGNSSLVMESKGHRIFFTIENLPGFIEIKKSGWTGFTYQCVINTEVINEMTQTVAENQDEVFKTKISETTFTQDEFSEHQVAWYVVKVVRIQDGVTTQVHRRFRDFAELNSQVKQNMKGHHLRWSLPPLPEKPLKSIKDHRDPSFIQDRLVKLDRFLSQLVTIPHVPEMICVKAFLGIMDQVREFSVSFQVPQLGMSLVQSSRPGDVSTPAVVGQVHKPDVCKGVLAGDTISKINGVPVTGFNFNGVVARIKSLPRPILVHFIQVIGNRSGATSSASSSSSSSPPPLPSTAPPLPSSAPRLPPTPPPPLPPSSSTSYPSAVSSSSSGKNGSVRNAESTPTLPSSTAMSHMKTPNRYEEDDGDAEATGEDFGYEESFISVESQYPSNDSFGHYSSNKSHNNSSSSSRAVPQSHPQSLASHEQQPLGWD